MCQHSMSKITRHPDGSAQALALPRNGSCRHRIWRRAIARTRAGNTAVPALARQFGKTARAGPALSAIVSGLASNKLTHLDVSGNSFRDVGATSLGLALRVNRTLTSLIYDDNDVTLPGFQAIRGCLYGNKKLALMPFPTNDAKKRDDKLTAEYTQGMTDAQRIKPLIGAAHRAGKWQLKQQEIENIKVAKRQARLAASEQSKMRKVLDEIDAAVKGNAELQHQRFVTKQAALRARKEVEQRAKWAAKQQSLLRKLHDKVARRACRRKEPQSVHSNGRCAAAAAAGRAGGSGGAGSGAGAGAGAGTAAASGIGASATASMGTAARRQRRGSRTDAKCDMTRGTSTATAVRFYLYRPATTTTATTATWRRWLWRRW